VILLFEEVSYTEDYLCNCLGKSFSTQKEASCFCAKKLKDGRYHLQCVGYFFNYEASEKKNRSVFILPKVFCSKEGENVRAFETVIPDRSNFEVTRVDGKPVASPRFLSELCFWLYSAINRYSKLPDCQSVVCPKAPEAKSYGHGENFSTLVDVKNCMEKFFKDNPNLFTFIFKNKHSGNDKIDWHKTLRKTPVLIGDPSSGAGMTPVYMEPVNKKKVFDLDDTLIVLYFSAMNYIEQTFGVPMPKSEFYKPLKVHEVDRLLNGRGIRELRRIKHKYFADKFLKLYNIMEGFFVWGARFTAGGSRMEYMLANKFNNVFETMIDSLISDQDQQIQDMKRLDDGKRIDHLYKEPGLIFADKKDGENKIWHIGDSKYYKEENTEGTEAIAKQYTYAKNIIQHYFDNEFFGNKKNSVHQGVVYRDELTEGYNVTPNFFIRGVLPKGAMFRNLKDGFGRDDEDSNRQWEHRNRHFDNRLFDRDTLLLQVYNVNFLFVLAAYASKNSSVQSFFREKARKYFRRNFIELLDCKYNFWALWPKSKWDGEDSVFETMAKNWDVLGEDSLPRKAFVLKHGRQLAGQMFKSKDVHCLILALEKDHPNNSISNTVKQDCDMISCVKAGDIWAEPERQREEGSFSEYRFDEEKFGFFVKQHEYIALKNSNRLKVPACIDGKKLSGACFSDVEIRKEGTNELDASVEYFLPCKMMIEQ